MIRSFTSAGRSAIVSSCRCAIGLTGSIMPVLAVALPMAVPSADGGMRLFVVLVDDGIRLAEGAQVEGVLKMSMVRCPKRVFTCSR